MFRRDKSRYPSLYRRLAGGFLLITVLGVALADFVPPTLKTAVFGYLIAVISCFYGYNTNEGSDGVRKAATNSVVISSLVVIPADVILVKCIFFLFPDQAI